MIGFHRALMERNKAKCILDAVKKHPCHFYIVTLYFSLDCIMLWNWNYLESSRMFTCNNISSINRNEACRRQPMTGLNFGDPVSLWVTDID